MKERLSEYSVLINKRLNELMDVYEADECSYQHKCAEAMRYSLSAGGKRIRPVLVMEFARIFSAKENAALDCACALEMIHTFSLIHDDLPCMDNDDFRRGRPSCHKAYGEDIALLAGDALENYAFEVISSDEQLSYEQRVRLVKCLSEAVGICGMIGGQVIDVRNIDKAFDSEKLLQMYSLKTGALIKCACRMGCICAGRYDMIESADRYSHALGLAFQIIDDILDITSDEKTLGKPVQSDIRSNKNTYPAVFGLDAAVDTARELTEKAINEIKQYNDSDFLVWLTGFLLDRKF